MQAQLTDALRRPAVGDYPRTFTRAWREDELINKIEHQINPIRGEISRLPNRGLDLLPELKRRQAERVAAAAESK